MSKLQLNQPTLFLLYGYPGAGKTYLARQLCEELHAAHIQAERVRYELFEKPRYDRHENEIMRHLMNYMTEEFLRAGLSVIYDVNASKIPQRKELRELAGSCKANVLMIWLQIDPDTAFARASKRDHRKADDKYAQIIDRRTFDTQAGTMQNPGEKEPFMVISGKHTYQTQKLSIMKRLYDLGLVSIENATSNMVKPGLVNLVPKYTAGRVDQARRNVIIR